MNDAQTYSLQLFTGDPVREFHNLSEVHGYLRENRMTISENFLREQAGIVDRNWVRFLSWLVMTATFMVPMYVILKPYMHVSVSNNPEMYWADRGFLVLGCLGLGITCYFLIRHLISELAARRNGPLHKVLRTHPDAPEAYVLYGELLQRLAHNKRIPMDFIRHMELSPQSASGMPQCPSRPIPPYDLS